MFTTEVQVRMADLNTSGHVSNVAFLELFDEARTRFFGGKMRHSTHRGIFDRGLFDKAHYVLGQHIIEYRRELFFALEPVRVSLWIPRIGRSSFVLNGELHESSSPEPACVIETTGVFLTHGDDRPWPIDAETRDLLAEYAGPRVVVRPRVALD